MTSAAGGKILKFYREAGAVGVIGVVADCAVGAAVKAIVLIVFCGGVACSKN